MGLLLTHSTHLTRQRSNITQINPFYSKLDDDCIIDIYTQGKAWKQSQYELSRGLKLKESVADYIIKY